MKTFYICFGIWMGSWPVRRGHSPRVETAKIWPPRSVSKTCDKNANGSEGGEHAGHGACKFDIRPAQ